MQPFYRSFTVLIVGSNGKCNHYKNELQSLGLEVITYDSFEESPQRLKDQYPKADIVMLLPTLSAKGLLKLHDRLQIC